MNDGFNPAQINALLLLIVGSHVIFLPAFLWSLRTRQFSGREQREWHLDDAEALPAPDPPASSYGSVSGRRARLMVWALGVMAALTLLSIAVTVFVATYAPAAAHLASGKCPFGY